MQKVPKSVFVKKEIKLVVDHIEEIEEIIEPEIKKWQASKNVQDANLPQHGIDECEYCGYIFERKINYNSLLKS